MVLRMVMMTIMIMMMVVVMMMVMMIVTMMMVMMMIMLMRSNVPIHVCMIDVVDNVDEEEMYQYMYMYTICVELFRTLTNVTGNVWVVQSWI